MANQITPQKRKRSITVEEPKINFSALAAMVMPRNNGTQAGIDALRASLERNK
ncbi:MAG: hypothetical protein P4L31_07675 [Candidatus Babeliales bacterium]|nr:hypothetical protein [Candidatus Babeliales bacterium]